ncbi:MAG: carboxypeptidase regulatory-like domain-containing protein, partial [Phycisphaerales bacterium]
SITQMEYARNAGADGFSTYSYRSTNNTGQTWSDWYPYVAANLFTASAPIPDMPWRDPAFATEGTLWGRVTDTITGDPMDDATVQVGSLDPVQTDGNGYYVVTLIPATAVGTAYDVTASYPGYSDRTEAGVVVAGDVSELDILLGDCLDDSDCDDGAFCNGAETCSGGSCVAGADACPGQVCDEDSDACVDCLTDADCDDGLFCNGAEQCENGTCVQGPDPCPGRLCDETFADACVECRTAGDCDDRDACTRDVCVMGECDHAPVVCPIGQLCDPDTGECLDLYCLTDADCDDENPCTLDECIEGMCRNMDIECPEGERCDSDTGECVEDTELGAGQCVPALCDDGDPCTIEECVDTDGDAVEECINRPVECLEGEECDADTGECVPEKAKTARGTTRGGCGLFSSLGFVTLPLYMLVWVGIRSRARRRG